ncbi:oligosaccharide flippase family protein [Sphingomonas sp. SUN019]|uniref:lipopolysaccharide biosynthesis protein n=1 Tax=Sphingomonas sp. SUN019 TaxID=2937788 RepID=UPI002164B2EE|nr:oligosaccharide flippase family protein [Sphingomonas sp. SUN019]UVO50928.1 oligosaccharide flippase family protein [Sphingomonas sp. SUN019]
MTAFGRPMFRRRADLRVAALVDLFALFAGRIGGILVTLLFIPRYHSLLGGATFGAVSIVLSLQAFFLVSDLGLATLISRDTAVARDDPDALTLVVWTRRRAEATLAAIAAAIAAVALAWPLLGRALFGEALASWALADGVNVAMMALLIMALVATNIVQLSLNALGAYQAGAATAVSGAVVRGAATVAVLSAYPTLTAFLQVQLLVALLHLFGVRWYLEHRCGPVRRREPLFQRAAMIDLLRRCIPLTIYTLASAAAVNLDKSIVSAFISLETAGSYFLATTYALVPVAVLSGPISSYFAPRVANARHIGDIGDEQRVALTFQLMLICAVVGPSLSLGFQMADWLRLWLHDASSIARVMEVAPILLAGGALSATGYYPTTYLIAAGDNGYLARLSLACSIAVLATATFFAARDDLVGFAWSYFAFYAAGFVGLWVRLGAITGWNRLASFLARAYALPAGAITASYLLGHALTRGRSWELELLVPMAAAGACSLLVLARVFRRERRSAGHHIN